MGIGDRGMAVPDSTGGDGPPPAGRYAMAVPPPLTPARAEALRAYVADRIAPHARTSSSIARYQELLARQYAADGAPHHVRELDERAQAGRPATNALGRTSWDTRTAALSCAGDVLRHGPRLLLAESVTAARGHAEDCFLIHGVSALFEAPTAVPVALERAYDEFKRADSAIADALATTSAVIRNSGCNLPIVCCEHGLADNIVGQLAGGDQAFAAAVYPGWSNKWIAPLDGRWLVSRAIEEVLSARDGVRRVEVAGRNVDLARLSWRDSAGCRLFFARVFGSPDMTFLLRPSAGEQDGVHEQFRRAAELAVVAAEVAHERPLATLGLERFYASEGEELRWRRHVALLQALLTFDLITPEA